MREEQHLERGLGEQARWGRPDVARQENHSQLHGRRSRCFVWGGEGLQLVASLDERMMAKGQGSGKGLLGLCLEHGRDGRAKDSHSGRGLGAWHCRAWMGPDKTVILAAGGSSLGADGTGSGPWRAQHERVEFQRWGRRRCRMSLERRARDLRMMMDVQCGKSAMIPPTLPWSLACVD